MAMIPPTSGHAPYYGSADRLEHRAENNQPTPLVADGIAEALQQMLGTLNIQQTPEVNLAAL